ncbi:MAG: helix-turn-helix domain-containing protein [Gaiellaceae bacterium]
MAETQTPALLTPAQVANRLGVSRVTVYRRVWDGSLPAFRVGETGPLRFEADAVERLLRPALTHPSDPTEST